MELTEKIANILKETDANAALDFRVALSNKGVKVNLRHLTGIPKQKHYPNLRVALKHALKDYKSSVEYNIENGHPLYSKEEFEAQLPLIERCVNLLNV